MKLITGILMLGAMAGTALAQNPDVIQDTRSTLQNVQKKQTMDQNAVLAAGSQAQSTPAPAANNAAPSKPSPAPSKPSAAASSAKSKPQAITITPVKTPKIAGQAPEPKTKAKAKSAPVAKAKPAQPAVPVAAENKKTPAEPKKEEKTYSSIGKRDPFVSPVVSRSVSGSGCSTGKRCLAIDQIALTGIVKSDEGMIAVVVNALNKAYFLRENDPVFNGYVVKITPDSIVFKETVQDKLGKSFEREVTKKINTPAV